MQEPPPRRSNSDRSHATRAALLTAARQLFVEKGYADTGTPEIVAAAKVTRGALYHHFADKQSLFRAVAENEAEHVATEIEKATPQELPAREALARGSDAYLVAMSIPGRTRLLLIDGPAVLGRAALDEIDSHYAAGSLKEGIAVAVTKGELPANLPVAATAQLLSAAFDRAAIAISEGADPKSYRDALRTILDGLAAVT